MYTTNVRRDECTLRFTGEICTLGIEETKPRERQNNSIVLCNDSDNIISHRICSLPWLHY